MQAVSILWKKTTHQTRYRDAIMLFLRKDNRTCESAFHVVFYRHLLSPRLLTDSTSLTIRSVGICFVCAEPVNGLDESKYIHVEHDAKSRLTGSVPFPQEDHICAPIQNPTSGFLPKSRQCLKSLLPVAVSATEADSQNSGDAGTTALYLHQEDLVLAHRSQSWHQQAPFFDESSFPGPATDFGDDQNRRHSSVFACSTMPSTFLLQCGSFFFDEDRTSKFTELSESSMR